MEDRQQRIAEGYEALAKSYARELFDELHGKPLDRALLAAFVEQAGPAILEVGCGPGHVTRYLAALGARATGIDLSAAMIAVARERSPEIDFRIGNMLALDQPDNAYDGLVAFYAIVHLESAELAPAFREFHRVVKPGGLMLVAFHLGDERLRPGELWGVKTELEWVFHPRARVEAAMTAASLRIEALLEREPYPNAEHPSRRAYLLARRPPSPISGQR